MYQDYNARAELLYRSLYRLFAVVAFFNSLSIAIFKVFLQLYVDEVAKVGGITSRHASTADDEAPPSPITMETDTPVIDAQFTSPQPMPLTASPMIPRTSPQAPSSSVNVHSPFAASPNVNSPGNIYGVGSPGEVFN